ncbi:hypothetical protein BEP19_00640 [Ammoniphilus oxalaticus]|uniref:FAD/FMN-containing dehydrogenase n=1 Tax=Ammoniphilus oxalaticus TaxID=66863 RepID=A0A419SRN8_9BACL|nr:hypothetical protein [Ammoniphilus oxalaticus]RKD27113.1 hypothetical protein BEP19_00640 [Ammoniphilus oxalaticus]
MKKMVIGGTLAALLVIGGIGGVWAAESVSPNSGNEKTFEDMLPFMKKMHPHTSDETFKKMYNDCHGEGGMMKGHHRHMGGNHWMHNMKES